ncbi:GNAT family N-acetyltransferase [Mechercharimyces sp. CAU 1602]|uniref:GNAT family N-acetyltransferase n=1 Tax=Mechercharimyces sp. CAU 1602 TaxID=2973933 RepID=UPI002162726C|nr:GNAT family N-acetyltransferase [Mechercharimyces sp. CAU 1602]MCS1351809.1 GNAT family N-acetyltransferase [Mechercharimyces sp. CAU 1602]
MKMRMLVKEDVYSFLHLRMQALREHPDAFCEDEDDFARKSRERLEREIESDCHHFILGAFQGTDLVGMVGFQREEGRKINHKAVVWGMYIIPELRGSRVGQALLEEVIARARAIEGVEQIQLAVGSWNNGAKKLYERCGFRSWGVEPGAMKVGQRYIDEEWMVLSL